MLKIFDETQEKKTQQQQQAKCQGGYSFDNTDFFGGVCSMIITTKQQ